MSEATPPRPFNRRSILSVTCAALTALSFCGGVAPIPLTGLICFPASAVFGLLALGLGMSALRRIRASRENGRTLALIGTWVGGLSLLAVVLVLMLGVALAPYIADFIRQVLHSSP